MEALLRLLPKPHRFQVIMIGKDLRFRREKELSIQMININYANYLGYMRKN
jgi:hypothetical protein